MQGNFTPSEGFRPRVLTSMTWRLTPGQVTLASDWSILSILTSYWSGFFPSLRHCRVAHGAVADGDTLYVTGGSAKVKLYTMRFKRIMTKRQKKTRQKSLIYKKVGMFFHFTGELFEKACLLKKLLNETQATY